MMVNQLSPGVRSSTHFSTALSPLSLEDPETADPPKGPVTFRIQDHSPWRPMVSESAASHRVHKSTFAKGFKFHTFADEKHVPGKTPDFIMISFIE
ncbi:hypothetical protein BIW11_06957 [Tropilaelaps mercedesae]|uniref:Uncharacterized protein n=1 Tax=Tropilaelaps mercedesae TaxID=418985 RepID=A0A1V9XVV0_9ACAR|nr:hypothetical protein BIW11_06957 [Tropilaelaps mercedesae]